MCGVVASSNQHDLVGLGKRCRHLRCNLGKSLKHKRENSGVSILLVGACLHSHPLGLSPANCLSCSCFSSTDQADLLTISSGGFNSFSPLTLSNCLHFVSFRLCWEFDGGYQLLLLPLDLLLLDLDLLPPLNHLDLDFLLSDSLLDLGGLQFIGQLCFGFRSVHFHVEVGLLQLEAAAVVLNFGVCTVLDIHGSFLTFCFPDSRVSVCLGDSDLGVSFHFSCLSLTQ